MPKISPRKTWLKIAEENFIPSLVKRPKDAEEKIKKPTKTRIITIDKKGLSTFLFFISKYYILRILKIKL